MTEANHSISVITLNVNKLNYLIKRQVLVSIKKMTDIYGICKDSLRCKEKIG